MDTIDKESKVFAFEMGGSSAKAKSTMDIVNNVTTNVSASMSSACGASNTSGQSITQIAGGNAVMDGVSQSQQSTVNLTCDITDTMESQFASQLQQQLSSELNAQLSGLGIKNSTETDSAIKAVTNAAANISLKSVKNCLAQSETTQAITQVAGGNAVMKNVSQAQVNSVIAKCSLGGNTVTSAAQTLDQTIASKGTSENKGFDPLGPLTALFSALGMTGAALTAAPWICCICIVIICIVCSMMMMGGGGGEHQGGGGFAIPLVPTRMY